MKIAVTGGTGFVGRHLLRLAAEQGHEIRGLARNPQKPSRNVDWVSGSLSDQAALDDLARGADAVIHVAGAINARDAAGFDAANVTGTANMLVAARAGGARRFVHVSSLAAREPGLSAYGASKARSEALVSGSGLDWDIVRPPAVYGPGDREMLELFRMAKRGVMLLPPGGRLSLIHVEDLARLLMALAETPARGATYEPDDGAPRDQAELAELIGQALGRRVRAIATPPAVLRLGARIDGLVRRDKAKLTPDRVRYFCHPDWTTAAQPPAELWQPRIAARDGLKATAEAYRRDGWL